MAFDSVAAPRVRVTIPINDDQKLRRRIERAVEKLLAVLDQVDGDCDLEEQWDRELVDERGPETGDAVPNYGSHHNQTLHGACY